MRQLYKTGHANSVLDGKHSERMFDAIEGERKVPLHNVNCNTYKMVNFHFIVSSIKSLLWICGFIFNALKPLHK